MTTFSKAIKFHEYQVKKFNTLSIKDSSYFNGYKMSLMAIEALKMVEESGMKKTLLEKVKERCKEDKSKTEEMFSWAKLND